MPTRESLDRLQSAFGQASQAFLAGQQAAQQRKAMEAEQVLKLAQMQQEAQSGQIRNMLTAANFLQGAEGMTDEQKDRFLRAVSPQLYQPEATGIEAKPLPPPRQAPLPVNEADIAARRSGQIPEFQAATAPRLETAIQTQVPSYFSGAVAEQKKSVELAKDAVQNIFKFIQDGSMPQEEAMKFMESYPKWLASGNLGDLYIPAQITGGNKAKLMALDLLRKEQDLARMRQQIATSSAAEEFTRARMQMLQGQTPEAKLAATQALSRARTMGSEQAKAYVSLQNVDSLTKDLKTIWDTYNQIPEIYRGPAAGRTIGKVGTFGKFNDLLVGYEDTKRFILAGLSRQVAEERGVLSNVDIERVSTLLPGLEDTPESAAKKMAMAQEFINNKVKATQRIAGLPETGLSGMITGLPKIEQRGAGEPSVPEQKPPAVALPESGLTPIVPGEVEEGFDRELDSLLNEFEEELY